MVKIRALVFDDEAGIRAIISYILENRGYEVLSFSDPVLCPVYLNSECPCPREYACADILITDIHMPRVTGLEFIENQMRNGCKAIAQNKAVISGAWTNDQLEQAKRLGCEVFQKPPGIDELTSWLDKCEKRIDPNRKLADLQELFKQDDKCLGTSQTDIN